MTSELLFAALASLVLLVPAAYATYRAATAPPRSAFEGECSGDDCRDCALLFGHPSQAPARKEITRRMPRQSRGGAL